MKKLFLIFALMLSACSGQPELFFGHLSTLPEGKEIRMEGVLEKRFSKTGSFEYILNDTWLTFDDDFPLEQLLNKKVTVTGKVHHFNNCAAKIDPNFPEQCRIGEQLRVNGIEAK